MKLVGVLLSLAVGFSISAGGETNKIARTTCLIPIYIGESVELINKRMGAPKLEYPLGSVLIHDFDICTIRSTNGIVFEVEPNVTALATKWFALHKTAPEGDPQAQYLIAKEYYRLEAYDLSATWFRYAAEQGDSDAQAGLAFQYLSGEGVASNAVLATVWMRKAAAQGNAIAKITLDLLADDLAQIESYERGVAEGDPEAMFQLAMCYGSDDYRGVEKDIHEAVRLARMAAEKGHAAACWFMANSYIAGNGVPKDYIQGVEWHRRAAEKGFPLSERSMGLYYMVGEDYPDNLGVKKNAKTAVGWFKKSAMQGDAIGQRFLAYCYASGEGVLEDFIEAYAWSLIAASNGEDDMKQELSVKYPISIQMDGQKRAKEISKSIHPFRGKYTQEEQ